MNSSDNDLEGLAQHVSEHERTRAIEEIGGQLRDLFNDPQYNEELYNIQNNLGNILTNQLLTPQFESFKEIMRPFLNRKSLAQLDHLDIEGMMISAQIASVLPNLAQKIYSWISENVSVTFQDLRQYSRDSDKDEDSDKGSRV